ncbi:MAG: HprK-related kinase A [Methylococcales bacterium]
MKVSDYSLDKLVDQAGSYDGFCFDIGSFVVNIKSREQRFLEILQTLYQYFPVAASDSFIDFHVRVSRPSNYRQWIKRQVLFEIDGRMLFEPFPLDHATPLFEWGLNWCIATRAHQYLMLHSAVVEKHGKALILPAFPGSGKSTLSAALAQKGWRFLSDEFGLIRPSDGRIVPIPRPTPLKNESIKVVRDFAPEAVLGPSFPKTRKGTIAHLRAPEESVQRLKDLAIPAWIIFPQYKAGSEVELTGVGKPYALFKLATNAFNYEVHGTVGFKMVRDLVKSCDCYNLMYSNLDDVIARLDDFVLVSDET